MDEYNNLLGVVGGWAVLFGVCALIIWTANRIKAWRDSRTPHWTEVLDRVDALLDVSAQRRVTK